MNVPELSIIIQSHLTLIVLAFVIFGLWPGQRTDLFRQQMFAVRDELFDFAADENISFDDPAYILLRGLMNGFIRYAHNLTPFRISTSYLRSKYIPTNSNDKWTESWDKALNQIENRETRAKLQQFHSKATDLVLGQLLLSPGPLIIGLPTLALAALLLIQYTSARNIYRGVTNRIPMAFLEEEAAQAKA
jgi:hypothetical protein